MDLSSLTPDQRACVEHVGGPLLVSAGAGSGKTFMLTQRIAYALLNPEKSGVTDVDQILAITFTSLAASEIKARVRNKLRQEGLTEQALKVDACWISTIHAMCSRILRENALELGLDPAFGLLDETDADVMLSEAISAALDEVRVAGMTGRGRRARGEDEEAGGDAPGGVAGGGCDPRFDSLFETFERSGRASSVAGMVKRVIDAAANVRGGLEAVVTRDALPPDEIARLMLDAMTSCDATAREGIGMNGKSKETFTTAARDALEDPMRGMPRFERLAASGACTYEDVALALAGVNAKFVTQSRKEPFKTAYALFRKAYKDLCLETSFGLVQDERDQLLELARGAAGHFEAAKRRAGKLDQNDLLLKTLDAFERFPDIEARYRDRFRLVMVDEFQDTSGLQIALISHLTDGDRRLCTVGDTQQSIYRFRGADVNTYREHKEHMKGLEEIGGMCRALDKNFRSHGDIITFVNRVFSQDAVFGTGGEFIKLGFNEKHAQKNPFPEVPRIDVVATTSTRGARGRRGASSLDRHLVEAEAIARRLRALHESGSKGCGWGDMVVLLGRMSNADLYADTLRAHGVPCIIAGGSGFDKTPEALEVRALALAVADPYDDEAMRDALTGSALGLDLEELTRLGVAPDRRRRHYWDGLRKAGESDPSPRVRLAAAVLGDAVARAGSSRRPSETLLDLVICSGWLDRLQAEGVQGTARAANVLKALRLVESIEGDPDHPRGMPATAERLDRKLGGGLKEKPGALMAENQDAVRIMTVHASKGLEFPVVVLADFYGLGKAGENPLLETVGDDVFLTLSAPASLVGKDAKGPYAGLTSVVLTEGQRQLFAENGWELAFEGEPREAESAVAFAQAVRAHAEAEELGELRRKFYVGATRPREALIVAVAVPNPPKSAATPYHDVVEDLCEGLYGHPREFSTAPEGVPFGGTMPARVERIDLEYADGTLVMGPTPEEASLMDNPVSEFLKPEMLERLATGGRAGGASGEGEGDDEDEETCGGEGAFGDAREGGLFDDEAEEKPLATVEVPEPPRRGEHPFDLVGEPRPCDPMRAGTFSYSGVASEGTLDGVDPDEAPREDEGPLAQIGEDDGDGSVTFSLPLPRPQGADPTAFGSALHQACQWGAERRAAGDGAFASPDDARLATIAATWGLDTRDVPALRRSLDLWLASDLAREAAAWRDVQPEAPFLATVAGPQGEPLHLEGSIDLFCSNPAGDPGAGGSDADAVGSDTPRRALVVDYKTGGHADESPERLREKHLLQASCYAYAVLSQGFDEVELAFVRLQQLDRERPDQPQTVRYRFGRGELQDLAERIVAAYRRAFGR